MEIFIYFIVALIGILFILSIIEAITSKTLEDKEVIEQTKLYSLENKTEINGSFVVSTGYVDDEMYYYYKEVISEEPLRLKNIKIPYNAYEIVLRDGIDYAYIEQKYKVTKTKSILGIVDGKELKDEYLVIPKNYVEQKYNID